MKRDEVIREAYIPEGFKPKAKTVDRNVLGPLPKLIPAVTQIFLLALNKHS